MNIQVTATKAVVEPEFDNGFNVTLTDVEEGELLNQFENRDLLTHIEYSEILAYVEEQEREKKEYRDLVDGENMHG